MHQIPIDLVGKMLGVEESMDDIGTLVLTVAVATALALCLWRMRTSDLHPEVRRADTPELLSAGVATVLSGDLVSSVIVRSCTPSAQMQLKCTSRAWRDAVRGEYPDWMFSHHEIALLAYLAETDVDSLLAAESLTLPPPSVIGHLSPEEGKGAGVLLRFNQVLSHLSVRRNTLGDAGIAYVAAALQGNATLRSLVVDSNEIGDEGAIALAKSLEHNHGLTYLSMRENGVGPEVHFRHEGETSGIGDAAAKALARMLARNDALTVLWLGSCEIGDEGARALASVLCDEGRAGQARSKANVSLTELDIRENQLSEGAKEELRVAAASRPGFTLRV